MRDIAGRTLVTGDEIEVRIDGLRVIGRVLLCVNDLVVWQVISDHSAWHRKILVDMPFDFLIIDKTRKRSARIQLPTELEAALMNEDHKKVALWVKHWAGR